MEIGALELENAAKRVLGRADRARELIDLTLKTRPEAQDLTVRLECEAKMRAHADALLDAAALLRANG